MQSYVSRSFLGNGEMPSQVSALCSARRSLEIMAIAAVGTLAPRAALNAHKANRIVSARPLHASLPMLELTRVNPQAQRHAGRVGANLTNSLRAVGVPELQGRQYAAVLSRAIQLAGGVSIEDKFDLIIQRKLLVSSLVRLGAWIAPAILLWAFWSYNGKYCLRAIRSWRR